jgi:hypothetical protein
LDSIPSVQRNKIRRSDFFNRILGGADCPVLLSKAR